MRRASAPSSTRARAPGSRRSAPPARATTTCGPASAWSRSKCDVRIGERRIRTEARGIEDESCGYHPHTTVWDWSAGVGETRDGRAGRLEPGRRGQRSRAGLRARDLGRRRRGCRAAAGDLRRPRGDRGRRRAAGVHGRGRAAQGAAQPVRVQLPPAVRDLHRHAARGPRARLRPRGDGAPRGELVAGLSRSASRDRPTPRASATAAPRPAPTRTGCARRASPAAPAPGSGRRAGELGRAARRPPCLRAARPTASLARDGRPV